MAQEIEKSNALGVSTSDVINFGSNSLIDLTGMPRANRRAKASICLRNDQSQKEGENLKIENA